MSSPRDNAVGTLRRVPQVIAWALIGGALLLIAAAVVVPRLAGATPYTVLTSSMEPTYPPGTLVVVKPFDESDLRTGDAITYQLHSGQQTVVTHRIVQTRSNLRGERSFITRGDANGADDAEPVLPVQVRGRVWYAVPHLGRVNTAVTGSQRQLGVYVVAAGLIGYTAFMFVGSLRDRRRPPTVRTESREEISA